MISYWIGIAAREHVDIAVSGGFAMFSHGEFAAVRKVSPGDWVAYYSPREKLDAGDAVRAFTAIGQVLDGKPCQREMTAGHVGWYRPVRWLDARPADIYPLLDRFGFVANRRHLGMYFRRSLFRIGGEDFALIADATGAGDVFRQSAQ